MISCVWDRMDDDGSFRVGHAHGEPRHRKVGCRAPHGNIRSDHRFDVPVAGGLDLGVLDDRFHDRSGGGQGGGEVVVYGHPGQHSADGGRLDSADLGQCRHALAQPVRQRPRLPSGRPGAYLVTGEGELLGEQMTDVARADDADRAVQRSCFRHGPSN